jgi:hypothetical protein
MRPATFTVALGTLLWLAGASAAQVVSHPPQPVPPLVMEDQFEHPAKLSDGLGRVVVLIYGDRRSADANKQLGEVLHVWFHPTARGLAPDKARQASVKPLEDAAPGTPGPDVVMVPVACIGKVPPLVRSLIRGQIRGGSPAVPVWLDFQDQMKQQFGLAAGVPNLVVVDTQGRLRCSATGPLNGEQFQQLEAAIEGLRREAVSASKAAPMR